MIKLKLDTSREYAESDEKTIVVGVRLKSNVINTLKEIAEERSKEGYTVNHTDLIREAIERVYGKELGLNFVDVAFEKIQARHISNNFTERNKDNIKEAFQTLLDNRLSFCVDLRKDFKSFINNNSLLRSEFGIDSLPKNATPTYDLAENSIVAENRTLHFKTQCSPITVPTWEMAVYPTIRLSEIKKALINQIDAKELYEQIFKKAALTYMLQEEKIFFKLLKHFSKNKDLYLLDDIKEFLQHEQGTVNPNYRILCPESKIGYLLKILNLKDNFNIKLLLNTKGTATIFNGIRIIKVSDEDLNKIVLIKKNDVNIVKDTDVTILPADDPMILRIGWVIYEELGMFINNSEDIKFFDVTDKD